MIFRRWRTLQDLSVRGSSENLSVERGTAVRLDFVRKLSREGRRVTTSRRVWLAMSGLAMFIACAADVANAGLAKEETSTEEGETVRSRVALVIGNDAYRSLPPQRCAVADARTVARALAASGFEVQLARDVTRRQMMTVLRRFAQASADRDVVLYFSGHGARMGGEDVLVPIDVKLDDPPDAVRDQVISLADVQSLFAENKTGSSVALWLDIDRGTDLTTQGRMGVSKGLSVPLGQFVLYAADTESRAIDCYDSGKQGQAGPFAAELAQAMRVPGATMAEVARQVRRRVMELTQGKGMQRPEFIDHSARDLVLGVPAGLLKGSVVDITEGR